MSIDYVNYSSHRRSLKIYTDSVASGKTGVRIENLKKKSKICFFYQLSIFVLIYPYMISGFKYQEAIASGGVKHLRNMRTHITIDIELDGGKILRICIKID